MKFLLPGLCFLLTFSALAQPGTAVVEGSVPPGIGVKRVYLRYDGASGYVNDSIDVQNGRFRFTVALSEPVLASLKYLLEHAIVRSEEGMRNLYYQPVFLAPGVISATTRDSMEATRVSGAGNDDFTRLNGQLQLLNRQTAFYAIESRKSLARRDTARAAVLSDSATYFSREHRNSFLGFAEQQPQSPVTLWALKQYFSMTVLPDYDRLGQVLPLLPEWMQQTATGQTLQRQLAIAKATAVGQPAPDFVQNDTLGKPVALSSFRGRWVLVDFWASWCRPCRDQNPNLLRAYNSFRGRNFTVLGVSLEQPNGQQRWLEAIRKDSLTWVQVSDLKYWDNAAAQQYGIRAIPANILIDPQGVIVAKNLEGEALHRKLEELLPPQ